MRVRNIHPRERGITIEGGVVLAFDKIAEVDDALGKRMVASGNAKQIHTRKKRKPSVKVDKQQQPDGE